MTSILMVTQELNIELLAKYLVDYENGEADRLSYILSPYELHLNLFCVWKPIHVGTAHHRHVHFRDECPGAQVAGNSNHRVWHSATLNWTTVPDGIGTGQITERKL